MANVTGTCSVQLVDHVCIKAAANHQQENSVPCPARIQLNGLSVAYQVRGSKWLGSQLQVLPQQVFRPQRKNANRNTRWRVVGYQRDCTVPASCDDRTQTSRLVGSCDARGKLLNFRYPD